jgi:hypothetical protein
MDWEEVADLQSPRKLVIFDTDSRGYAVERERKYDPDRLQQLLADGELSQGFAFQYVFTADDAVNVAFDSTGKMTGMNKLMTTSDLLQGNLMSR